MYFTLFYIYRLLTRKILLNNTNKDLKLEQNFVIDSFYHFHMQNFILLLYKLHIILNIHNKTDKQVTNNST